jgi:uncharacterized protein YjbJ (UPF0337 family)
MEKLVELKGDWKETKRKLKQKFVMLTDSDLLLVNGRHDEMFRRLQVKLGKTKEEILNLISSL